MKKIVLMFVLMLTVLIVGACQGSNEDDRPTVVTTTTYIGDLVRNVGGPYVNVVTLMDVGIDPHDYQPRQSDTDALMSADLVVVNGFNLEEKMGEVIGNLPDASVVRLSDFVDEEKVLFEEAGVPDPHFWFDVMIWASLTEAIADALSDIDESNAAHYQARHLAYNQELRMLDAYVQSRVNELPEEKRVLVTAHDAFAYFGAAYGVEVYAIQGISTASEASIRDIENLADLLVEKNIKSVFVETSVPESTVQALTEAANAQGHDARIAGSLFSDSTGGYATGHETYIRTFQANIDQIVDALLDE